MSGSMELTRFVCLCVVCVCEWSSANDDKVMAATQEAQDEVEALNAQAERQIEELSQLRAEKQLLQKKINVAVQERSQMDHASKALAADNISLHKAAEQLAAKIDKCNAER